MTLAIRMQSGMARSSARFSVLEGLTVSLYILGTGHSAVIPWPLGGSCCGNAEGLGAHLVTWQALRSSLYNTSQPHGSSLKNFKDSSVASFTTLRLKASSFWLTHIYTVFQNVMDLPHILYPVVTCSHCLLLLPLGSVPSVEQFFEKIADG